jgi:hypothetical protein
MKTLLSFLTGISSRMMTILFRIREAPNSKPDPEIIRFLIPSRQILRQYYKNGHDCFFLHNIPITWGFHLSIDAIQCAVVKYCNMNHRLIHRISHNTKPIPDYNLPTVLYESETLSLA